MQSVRLWSVRHSAGLAALYHVFERVIVAIEPIVHRIGHHRLERPVATVERALKKTMFDCRMCGECVLSSTGMSCPMNCPKNLRNGPCGGVRADGMCEIEPEMACVWVKAWEGARNMGGHTIDPLAPIDHRLEGRSSWLRIMRMKREAT